MEKGMNRLLVTFLAVAQVIFITNLHCEKCAEKIRENVSFEKGVKDLSVDVDSKEVGIVFNTAKTDTLTLKKAIVRLGYSAEVKEYKIIK